MKIYRELDKSEYQMDFCVSKKEKGFYDDEIQKLGGKIFVIPQKSKNPIKSFLALKRIVKENKYKYVLRTSQQSLATLDLIAAKLGEAQKLIYRSSNAGLTGGRLGKIINSIFKFLPKVVPNVKIAPSTEAATFVFGEKAVKRGDVILLHNGLKYDNFRFDKNIRKKIREELNIGDKKLYGHIGRFNAQKNHMFLLEVFKKILEKDNNSVLLLIGDGELKEAVIKKIKELEIKDNVIVLPAKSNINEYLMAMDMLIFPSLFEGMPNVIIEAQATGLRCVTSDCITKESNITGLVKYVSLNQPANEWYKEISDWYINNREDTYEFFKKSGYLIGDVAKHFVNNCF